MPALFTLDIETEAEAHRATLRLGDEAGNHLDAWELDLAQHPPARWSALFDTRRHIEAQEPTASAQSQLTDLGHFIAQNLLGPEITQALTEGFDPRALLIHLPDPTTHPLAADLCRVPWEMAIGPTSNQTLLEHNVALRIAPAGIEPARDRSLTLRPGEPLHVLLVFAEAPGARPLAARLERERLLDLFVHDILPGRDVQVDVLAHGVTRPLLEEQLRSRGGYHLIHWSGHGHPDGLELSREDGTLPLRITGADLTRLFSNAGGFLPALMFLSACHSGSVEKSAARPGSTGAALALLGAGVKQVVAMRYEIGDIHARRLARRFYRGLLAEDAHHPADEALLLARRDLLGDSARASDYHPMDHATPIIFGSSPVRFQPGARRGKQMSPWRPRRDLLPEGNHSLDRPPSFVGREGLLTQLARRWLARGRHSAKATPIALLLGPPGIGKTTLAAEALHACFGRFDHLLAFQGEGKSLSLEALLQRLHGDLRRQSPAYEQRCEDNAGQALFLPATAALTGAARQEAARHNLIEALGAERILLVLDGFEASLLSHPQAEGHAARDPAWDALLTALADRLGDTGSRLLITSRLAPAALARSPHTLTLSLDLLPRRDVAVFFEADPFLRALCPRGPHAALGDRLRDRSLGHPWILARIAELARKGRAQPGLLSAAAKVALEDALARLDAGGHEALAAAFPEGRQTGATPHAPAAAVAASLPELLNR